MTFLLVFFFHCFKWNLLLRSSSFTFSESVTNFLCVYKQFHCESSQIRQSKPKKCKEKPQTTGYYSSIFFGRRRKGQICVHRIVLEDALKVYIMDQLTIQTPKQNVVISNDWPVKGLCGSCLSECIDLRYSQSCWYFRPSFVNCCRSNLLSGSTLTDSPPSLCQSTVYTDSVRLRGVGGC